MSDNKKYYYLKLKENFYDSEAMIILEGMIDGYLYSNILTKLYLRSLKNEGKLMFNDRIPYNATILSQIVRHNVGVVEKALAIFKELGLIEVLDNGAIYMMDIQNFIGHSSTEADRKRVYRERISEQSGQMSLECPDKNPPEIEIKKELKIEKKINIDIEKIYNEWNKKNKTSLKGDKQVVKNLETILKNYTIEDVIKVIDYMILDKKTYLDQGYLTLSTLSKPSLFAGKLERAHNFKPKQSTLDLLHRCNDNDYSGEF